MNKQEIKYLIMGRIAGLHGVKGWLKVVSYTRPRENLLTYSTWRLHVDGNWLPYQCRDSRVHGRHLIAAFEGIEDRDQARAVIGADIAVVRDQLPALAEGEYYWCDLIGLSVMTRQGVRLGQVLRLEETGEHDLLVVGEAGVTEQLIPYVPGIYVLDISLGDAVVTVDWPAAAPNE